MESKAILCVDDEPIILLSLKATLAREFKGEYLVTTAIDAESAMAAIDDLGSMGVDVALILTDWLMPGLKGDEFLAAVHAKHPAIPSIMVTGQAEDSCIERAKRECGLFSCVRKPWNSVSLLKAVRECIATAPLSA